MSSHELWMVGVAVAALALVVFLGLIVPRGQERYRRQVENEMVRTTGRSVQLIRSQGGPTYEVVEFRDVHGTRVVGRPAPPSRTVMDREGQEVTVRYRADNPRLFVTEPLR